MNPTMIPATPELRAHIHALAKAFNVRILEAPGLLPHEAMALPHLRAVLATPVVDETTYAVDLHELGHLLHPAGLLRTRPDDVRNVARNANLTRDEENAAWTWARANALIWTPVMDRLARWAESTYAAVEPVAPPAPVAPKSINWNDWK